jgi:chorismate mutase
MPAFLRYLFRPAQSARSMSSSAPLADIPQASASAEDPPSPDHWPGGLPALRAELDRIDDAMHDLLIQRAKVVEHVARTGKPAALRPGREASIIRRLLARHTGSLPPQTLFRIWRELLAGTTAMQAQFVVAVCDMEAGAGLTQLAREHFGTLTPLRSFGSPGQALNELSTRAASVAVLPFPSEADGWWTTLSQREPRIHVIARLPFWSVRAEGAPSMPALVVAPFAPDASGQDRSLLALELDPDVSRTRLSNELAAAGLPPDRMVLRREPNAPVAQVLVEVDGFVADDDPRLGAVPRRPVVLGSYAVPVGGGAA